MPPLYPCGMSRQVYVKDKRAGDVPGTAVAMCAYTSSPSRGYLSLYPTLREAQRALSDGIILYNVTRYKYIVVWWWRTLMTVPWARVGGRDETTYESRCFYDTKIEKLQNGQTRKLREPPPHTSRATTT